MGYAGSPRGKPFELARVKLHSQHPVNNVDKLLNLLTF